LMIYGVLIAMRAQETLPKGQPDVTHQNLLKGYGQIFKDKAFMGFAGAFTLTSMLASLVWMLLPVYVNTNYGIPESKYGFLPTTNALMVVFFQFAVTMVTRRFKSLPVMVVGTSFYTLAIVLVAFSNNFWGFLMCMVIMTIGELVISPTATTYTANLAPENMRGRYMSIYGLTWSVATGIAPVIGGLLSDNLGPRSTWFGGGIIGVISILAYLVLSNKFGQKDPLPAVKVS